MEEYSKYLENINVSTKEILKNIDASSLNSEIRKILFEKNIYHNSMINKHQKVLDDIRFLMNVIDENELKSEKNNSEKINEYRTKEFWRKQIIKLLDESEIALKSSNILESVPINYNEKRNCMSILSNVLAEMSKDENKEINRYKVNGEKGYYYGLPNKPFLK